MLSKTIAEILNGDDPWHYATFEGAVQLQLKIDARTSLAEKLEWLEQAGRLARQLEKENNKDAANSVRHDCCCRVVIDGTALACNISVIFFVFGMKAAA